jgi:esterase/lipase superfamily enzyme
MHEGAPVFSACVARLSVACASFILAGALHPALGDPREVVSLSRHAQDLVQAGKTLEAIPVAQQVVALSKVEFGEESAPYATALNRLAQMYRVTGKWDEAEQLYKRARAIREQHDKGKLADTLNDLGLLYLASGRYPEAEPLLIGAVADYSSKYGPDDVYVATSSANLALLYRAQGRYAEAESLMQRALTVRKQKRGPEHVEVANSLSSLASLYREQRRFPEAEALVNEALGIRRKTLNPEHPDIASSLNVLGEIYRAEGRYALAEDSVNQALAIRKKAYPADHPSIATALNSLGNIFEDQGRLAEAERAYKESLLIDEATLRADNPDLATARANLGALYKAQARYGEAEPLLRAALEIREKVLDSHHPDLIMSLILMGELNREQGKAKDAETYFEKAKALRRSAIREVSVYFATNRQRVDKTAAVAFAGDRAEAVTIGYANVWVPDQAKRQAQTIGQLADDVASADETTAMDRLVIQKISILSDDELVQSARATLRASHLHKGEALVFVHGFNVSFANAVRRTAQLAYDLNFDGPAFLFSWPSRGGTGTLGGLLTLRHYPYDLESADLSVQYLLDFLTGVLAKTGAKKVHLIAHSMGNRPMLEALERLKLMGPSSTGFSIGEIVLASPDVEVGRFKQLVAAVRALPAKMTLYASTRDRALGVSQWVWGGGARAGNVTKDGPLVTNGVDSIDISTAGANPFELNHDVYVSNPTIFKDMRVMLENGLRPPDQRSRNFAPTTGNGGTYWTFRTAKPAAR